MGTLPTLPKLNDKRRVLKDDKKIYVNVVRIVISTADLKDYLKKAYYQGWNDCTEDTHGKADDFINSLF